MSETDNPTVLDLRHLLAHIDSIGKMLVFCFGLLYITGMLVVAFHLSRYGLPSLSLVRTEYIVAGLFMLVPTALTLGFLIAMFWPHAISLLSNYINQGGSVPHSIGKGRSRAFIVLLSVRLQVLLAMLIAVYLMDTFFKTNFFRLHLVQVLMWIGGNALLGLLTMHVLTYTLSAMRKPDEYLTGQSLFTVLFFCGLLLPSALLVIQNFAENVYPLIPYEYGGGQTLPVVLVLKNKETRAAIDTDVSGEKSVPYQLLMETDDSYFLVSKKGTERAIELKKDAVVALLVLDH